MKKWTKLSALLLCVLLLAGCGKKEKTASGGDVETPAAESSTEGMQQTASAGDQQFLASTEALLLDGNGYWRSEQQGPEDDGVLVRELELLPDGTFKYREGDWGSEYYYFAGGSWTLNGEILEFEFSETDELGAVISGTEGQFVRYDVSFDREMLLLTQHDKAGFCDGAQGFVIYFFHPIV